MQLKLNAHLNAYSKAPFYSDWVRDISPTGDYDPNIVWARALDESGNTVWTPLNKALLDSDALDRVFARLEEAESSVNEGLQSIFITAPRYDAESKQLVIRFYNKHGWINESGAVQYIQQIAFPSSYTDNKTIYKDVQNSSLLSLVDIPDDDTIEIVPTQLRETSDAVGNIHEIQTGKFRARAVFVEEPKSKWVESNKLTGDTIDVALHHYDEELEDIKAIVQGEAGYLDPMPESFRGQGESLSAALTRWALQELKLQTAAQIPNNTKVLYPEESHPANRNLYVFVTANLYTDPWKDMGKDTIVEATNTGVLGVVTGTDKKYGVRIVPNYIDDKWLVHTGEMEVNGVEDEFTQVVYKGENSSERQLNQAYIQTEENKQARAEISQQVDYNTLVMRTEDGTVRCAEPINETDAVNKAWFMKQVMTSDEIDALLEEVLDG